MGNNILENIKEQNNKINQCADIVNGYSIDEEIRLNKELKINEQIRQQNELIRQEQYNNNENRFTLINEQLETKTIQLSFLDKMKLQFVYGASVESLDNSTSFNNAFQNEEIVYIPKGIWNLKSGLITSKSNIIGEGDKSILNFSNDYTGVLLSIINTSGVFKDFKIIGNQQENDSVVAGNYGLSINNCNNFILENVTVERSGSYGIIITECNTFTVDKCIINKTARDGIHTTRRCYNYSITNCKVNESGDDGIVSYSPTADTTPCDTFIIANNLITKSKSRAINVSGSKNGIIVNNVVNQSKNAGIYIGKESDFITQNIKINNNLLLDCGQYNVGAIKQTMPRGVVIVGDLLNIELSNNTVINAKDRGYLISGGTNYTIENNKAYNCGGSGFDIQSLSNSKITGNIAKNNANHGFVVNLTNFNFSDNYAENNGGTTSTNYNIMLSYCNDGITNSNVSSGERQLYYAGCNRIRVVGDKLLNGSTLNYSSSCTELELAYVIQSSGVPTATTRYKNGTLNLDTTNNKLYVYSNGWIALN